MIPAISPMDLRTLPNNVFLFATVLRAVYSLLRIWTTRKMTRKTLVTLASTPVRCIPAALALTKPTTGVV